MKSQNIISFPQAITPNFRMIDVGRKRPTRRYAVACGTIHMGQESFNRVKEGTLPKGNVLALAEAAGIMGAKNTPNLIPMCHTIPLDQVEIHCVLDEERHCIVVYAQSIAIAKTGVEMEALSGASAALLTIWDLVKGVDPALRIGEVKLLVKTGGKSGVWVNPEGIPDWLRDQLPRPDFLTGFTASLVVMSDRASQGVYADETGAVINHYLEAAGASLRGYQVIPDDAEIIEQTTLSLCRNEQPDLLLMSGGTGPGPRDVTPEVLARIFDKHLEGFGDMLRHESLHLADTAWLSRMTAGMIGKTFVIALPGSPKAVRECWDIFSPFLADTLIKIRKQGYEVAHG
ncbi:MAG: bifunctional molybdenum cofactor biosynthesis protein MoaC/MoaB [Pseudobdellovibrionaceae bacterium]